MAMQTEKLPELRAIIFALHGAIETLEEPARSMAETVAFKKEVDGIVFRVVDFTDAQLDFSNLVMGMAMEKQHEGGAFDPEVATIYVGVHDLVELGVRAFKEQEQYAGSNVIGLVSTRQEALDLIRAQLAEE